MTELARLLTQALRYPWQGKGWFYRMLPLALLQLIPILGQIILAGYGQAIARAICLAAARSTQTSLTSIFGRRLTTSCSRNRLRLFRI